jgi:Raf kinase inhibitor-like YbhB/YbcL family protein
MGTSVREDWKVVHSKIRSRVTLFPCAVGFALVLGVLAGCRGSATLGERTPTLNLTSSSFQGSEIRKQFTCDGSETPPELAWSAPPAETKSFALIVVDRDSPFGYSFVHWVLYDLPAEKRELPEGLPKQEQLPDGSRQGLNDYDKAGYVGPCPSGSSAHRYAFALYALDSRLNLPAGATRRQVENALKGHVLAHGELVGRYKR